RRRRPPRSVQGLRVEQDEDAHAHPGGWPRSDLGLRADGIGARPQGAAATGAAIVSANSGVRTLPRAKLKRERSPALARCSKWPHNFADLSIRFSQTA